MDPTCYCFPEIIKTRADCRSQSSRPGPDFRRTLLGGAARSGRPERPATGGAGRGREPEAPGLEDVAQEAYCRGFGEGERSGFEKGRAAMAEEGRQELERTLEGLRQASSGLEDLRRSFGLGIEREIVQLALAVARKVVGRELKADPEALAGIVCEALGRVESSGRITIKMNPEDLSRLSEIQPRILSRFTDSGLTVFAPDDAISPGGCLIETETGEIDARLEQQFRVLEEAFRVELAGAPEQG